MGAPMLRFRPQGEIYGGSVKREGIGYSFGVCFPFHVSNHLHECGGRWLLRGRLLGAVSPWPIGTDVQPVERNCSRTLVV